MSAFDDQTSDPLGLSALMQHAQNGDLTRLMAVLPHSDPQRLDGFGESALMVAARAGHVECVRALIPLSDVDLRNSDRHTALMLAAHAGRPDCVKALLECGAPFSGRDLAGRNALMLALSSGNPESVSLLAAKSDLDQKNAQGETALMIAVVRNSVENINILLARNPSRQRETLNRQGQTPLMLAASLGHLECLRALIPTPYEEKPVRGGSNALKVSLSIGREDCARALLEALSGPNKAEMVLDAMTLERFGFKGAFDLLVEHCDPRHANEYGETAFMQAFRHHEWDCAKTLLPQSDLSQRLQASPDTSMIEVAWKRAVYGAERESRELLDLMACYAPREEALRILRLAGTIMPRFKAHLEREAIQKAVSDQAVDTASPQQSFGKAAQGQGQGQGQGQTTPCPSENGVSEPHPKKPKAIRL